MRMNRLWSGRVMSNKSRMIGERIHFDGCPICYAEMRRTFSYIRKDNDEPKLWYSHVVCPYGHYSVDFSDGVHSLTILGRKFVYSKDMSMGSAMNHSRLFAVMMLRARIGSEMQGKRYTASM